MNWHRIIQKYGWKVEEVGADPFHPLDLQAQQARATGQSTARISMNVGTSVDYGNLKVSCMVNIECVQTDAAISMAGECAFMKGLELVNDGARYLGIQELRQPA